MASESTINADLANNVPEALVGGPAPAATATTATATMMTTTATTTVNQNKRVHEAMDMSGGGDERDGGCSDSDSEILSEPEPKAESSSPGKADAPHLAQTQAAAPQQSSNVDLMQMMLMIRQQQQQQQHISEEPLQRTASNSSTSSSLSSASSVTDHMNENSLKQFIMSITANGSSPLSGNAHSNLTTATSQVPDGPDKAAQLAAAFADQFAYMVRSRSSSLSDTSSTSSSMSSSSVSATSSTEVLQNPVTASLMKQMLSSYQAVLGQPQPSSCNSNQQQQQQQHQYQDSSVCNRKSSNASSCSSYGSSELSQIGQTSSLLNNCNLENTTTALKQPQQSQQQQPHQHQLASASLAMIDGSKATDEVIKAKLNAVSTVKSLGQQQQVKQDWPAAAGLAKPETTSGTSPCRVCGDEASGFHYGVDSCEGCKGFFRRCITQGMNHQCTNQQQCEMTPFSRNSCQFCRLKKCFAVGMSREASRLGRRPKRPKDEKMADASWTPGSSGFASPTTTPSKGQLDHEVHKQAAANSQPKCSSASKLATSAATEATTVAATGTSSPNRQSAKKDKLGSASEQTHAQSLGRPTSIAPPPFRLEVPASRQQQQQQQQQQHQVQIEASFAQRQKEQKDQKEQMQQIEMLTKLISISDRHTSIERTNELEFIRTAIIEAHCQIWPTTFEKIRNRYLERPPVRATNNSGLVTGGATKPSSHEMIWDTFVDAMVPLIMDVVKYCKYIPSFNQILQHDQVQLLKQGSFEVICVNSFMLVDAQNKLMLTPDMEYLMDASTIKTMPLGFFMSEVFELGIQVSPLKLSDAEIALFNALLVMNPDRGDLQDKDHIEELQSTLLHVLYKHLKYYRSDEPDLFCKLLKLIPVVQEINRKHSEALNTIKMSQSSAPKNLNNSSGNGDLNCCDSVSAQAPVPNSPFPAHQPLTTGPPGEFHSKSIQSQHPQYPQQHQQPHQHQNQHQHQQPQQYQRPQAHPMFKLEINTNGVN